MSSLRLLPNVLTLFRTLAVGPIVYWLLTGEYKSAFYLGMAAGASDLLDGYLARRFGWVTHFGGVLDPLADKLMLISISLSLAWLGHLPWWLVAMIITRDLLIVGGGTYYHYRIAPVTADPTMLSKINTLLLILLVVVVMLRLAFPSLQGPWEQGLIVAVAATTVITGIQYVVVWSRKAQEEKGRKEASSGEGEADHAETD